MFRILPAALAVLLALQARAADDAERGRAAIARHGCAACHLIPGIRGADGTVGPPLTAYGRRVYVAGLLPNTTDSLARWLRDPPALQPRTAMPRLDLTEQEARDVAAYLLRLD